MEMRKDYLDKVNKIEHSQEASQQGSERRYK